MTKKTSAEYQREYRKRLREQGLVKKEVWILPGNSKPLRALEKELRMPFDGEDIDFTSGGKKMKEELNGKWSTESLYAALVGQPAFGGESCSLEIIDGIDSSIVSIMHEYGDLPIFITVGGQQILAEAVLFAVDDVVDVAKFNEYVLKTHKYLPLSTISIESDSEHGDYYHMFGALSATSVIEEVVQEIEILAENTIQATEAFHGFIKA